jgi:ribosomal protein L17
VASASFGAVVSWVVQYINDKRQEKQNEKITIYVAKNSKIVASIYIKSIKNMFFKKNLKICDENIDKVLELTKMGDLSNVRIYDKIKQEHIQKTWIEYLAHEYKEMQYFYNRIIC